MPPSRVQIAWLKTYESDRPMWMRQGRARAVPARFIAEAKLDDPLCYVRLDIVVSETEQPGDRHPAPVLPVVREVTVQRVEDNRPFGPPITASALHRVAIDTILRQALVKVSQPIVLVSDRDGWTGIFQLQRDVDAGDSETAWGGRRLGILKGAGRRTSDEQLRRVAEIYRAAVAAGTPPTMAVADELHVSRSHAGRLVGQAREAGHLGTTRRGKAGEDSA